MTLKALAHLAQQTLQSRANCPVKRSHVRELLAAAFGHGSWAAFISESALADAGVGSAPAVGLRDLIGRAVQLGHEQHAAATIATALQALIAEHRLSMVTLVDLRAALLPAPQWANRDEPDADNDIDGFDDMDDDEPGWDDEPTGVAPSASGLAREQLMGSPMLLSSLEQAAGPANPTGHFLVAALCRCRRPNPYLYEESLKGRVLTASEQGWVDDYLRLEPQYRTYEAHLKAAAQGGIRAAALEYGTAFDAPEFIALAERLSGEVDALEMARHAASDDVRERWLRTAAEQGSQTALEALASQGDAWAEDRVAEWADDHWLRSAAERALDSGNILRAWTWQYLALERGGDLTCSTLAAFHEGGERDGQFYDSDFGGPLYAGGDEGLWLPDLDPPLHEIAKADAEAIFSRAR